MRMATVVSMAVAVLTLGTGVCGAAENEHRAISTSTITAQVCLCPYQGDLDADGFPTALDLGELIDVLFEGTADPQDVNCPATRADCNGNGFADAVDLILFVDYLFAAGAGPADPCTCPGGFPCPYSYNTQPGSAVTVTSKSASLGETGVTIPIIPSKTPSAIPFRSGDQYGRIKRSSRTNCFIASQSGGMSCRVVDEVTPSRTWFWFWPMPAVHTPCIGSGIPLNSTQWRVLASC